MDKSTIDKIIQKANYALQKPRKKESDTIIVIAGVLITGMVKGEDWENETLKSFGIKDPLNPEEKDRILKKAEQLIL